MRYKENETNLGIWLRYQQESKQKGTLCATHKMQLNDIGVIWNNAR